MTRVAVLTCRRLPEPDPDHEPLLESLRHAGADACPLAWDDGSADPAAFDVCVLRSTWTYHLDPDRFLAFCARCDAESILLNPLGVVRGNIHKRYLRALERRGVPVIPTEFVPRGADADLAAISRRRGWDRVVVKPAISAASWRTRVFSRADTDVGQAFLSELLRDRDAMVQRFMPEVGRSGERSIVWIAGEPTHAVRKAPRLAGEDERVSGALRVSDEEVRISRAALGGVERECLYARVDLIRDDAGGPLVSELELIEPSLFLIQHPPALARLRDSILTAAGG
ncbi:MAG: hypothetical protein D6693_03875 [Planctomycetota bacterium]|nr:MAG: hypothetical protein D6693_03875 [Planctomycetota bacterium]